MRKNFVDRPQVVGKVFWLWGDVKGEEGFVDFVDLITHLCCILSSDKQMGKIIDYIQGDGTKFTCFRTKKYSLEPTDFNDNIAYNYDRSQKQDTKGKFAETNKSQVDLVSLRKMLNSS